MRLHEENVRGPFIKIQLDYATGAGPFSATFINHPYLIGPIGGESPEQCLEKLMVEVRLSGAWHPRTE